MTSVLTSVTPARNVGCCAGCSERTTSQMRRKAQDSTQTRHTWSLSWL